MRKPVGMTILLWLGLLMAGCGGGSSSGNINGNWSASLTSSPNGPPVYAFSTTFTEASSGGLTITNFTFTTAGSCFAPDATSETGSFTLSGNSSGNVTGSFGMTISTLFPGGTNNVLTLNGTVSGNTVSGTWNLTGLTGCSGSGNFTITKS